MAGSVGVAVVVGVVLMSQATPTRAFNLDTGASYLLWEPSLPYQERETYFGYTVALYAAGSQAWALVGAPRANNTLGIYRPTDIPEPGSLYACPLQGREALKCAQIQVDPTGNVAENWGGDGGTVDMKNYGWLGGSLDLLQDDLTIALVVTCSPRWKNQIFASRDEDYYMNGACYWASFTQLLDKEFSYEPWNKIIPLGDLRQQRVVDPSTGEVIYYYQMGQAGLSAHIMKDGQGVVLGAPGVKNWAGTVTTVQEDSDWNIIDSRYKRRKRSNIFFTKTNVFTPSSQVQQLEYFGYSVTSGRFWGDEDYIVAGAPRADLTGRVYIFKRGDETRMEVEWVGLGSQLGSGYGHAVAAGDVTGDGWSELLVGAPLYAPNIAAQGSKAETSEAGMVVVYGRAGVGDLREAGVLQGAPLAPGARFGSTISVVGDLDRDGFNDVAVGAPYEDGGRGAVYIYRGGADGLQTKLSQKILASDLSQALKGFGVAISRGVDVDQNGYVDVGVGAYSGSKGAAAVLRTRTVATVASRVVSTVAVITELRAEVRLALCLTYDGKQVQKRVGMDVNGTVDENLTPRATFVTTNTSHVISKATLEQGVETCLTFVLNMKENLQDLERPLEVTFKFHSDDFDPGRPWCVECSVLAPWASTSAKISFPLALGCGTDGVCNPDLTITAAWTSGLASGRYTVGSLNPLTITVKVKARGEPAYLGWVQMSLPPGLGIRTLPYSCKIINSTTAYCTLQNPFYQREETLELELQEEEGEMKGVLGMSVGGPAKMVEVKVEAGATGTYPQTLSLPLPLSYDVQLSLEGYADVEYYFYDPNIPAPKVNSEVTFKAENSGVTGVTSVVVEVLVPLAYSPPSGEANVTFGTLTKLLVIPEGGLNLCRMGDPETIMGGVGVGVETSFPPTETELKVTCGIVGVVCGRVLCTLSGLHQGPRVLLQAEYNLTMLITRYGPNTTVGIHTWASLTNSSSGTNTSAGVWVGMVPRGWSPPAPLPREVPFWVYLVAVVGGALILVVLVLVLVKIGFFRRKKMNTDTSAAPAGEDPEHTALDDLQIADESLEDHLETGSNGLTSFNSVNDSNVVNDSSGQEGYNDPSREPESQEPLLE